MRRIGRWGLLALVAWCTSWPAPGHAQISTIRMIEDGSIYHRQTCPTLQGHVSRGIDPEDLSEAHIACVICRPDAGPPSMTYARPPRVVIERDVLETEEADASSNVAEPADAGLLVSAPPPAAPVFLVDLFAEATLWRVEGSTIFHREGCVTLQGHRRVAVDRWELTDSHTACRVCLPRGAPPRASYLPERVALPELPTVPVADAVAAIVEAIEAARAPAAEAALSVATAPGAALSPTTEGPDVGAMAGVVKGPGAPAGGQTPAVARASEVAPLTWVEGPLPLAVPTAADTAMTPSDDGDAGAAVSASGATVPSEGAGLAVPATTAAGTTVSGELEPTVIVPVPFVSEDGALELTLTTTMGVGSASWERIDWTLTASSTHPEPLTFDADILLQDAAGAVVADDRLHRVAVLPGSARRFTGYVRVDPALAPTITAALSRPVAQPEVPVRATTVDVGIVPVADTPTSARTLRGEYISWREHLIDDETLSGGVVLRGADGLAVADLDRDGHLDIVSVHEDNHHVRLAFGTGDPDEWVLATLAAGDEAKGAEDVSIADANGDGFPDIVVACESAHLIYFQNPRERIRDGDWPRVVPAIARDRGSFIRVAFADIDHDGRPEVAAANKGSEDHATELLGLDPARRFMGGAAGGQAKRSARSERSAISLFELPRDPLDGEGWRERVLARVDIPINAAPVDLDEDGDLDIVGGSRGESRVLWFENAGGANLRFEGHRVSAGGQARFWEHRIRVAGRTVPREAGVMRLTGMNLAFQDINQDGRVDVVLQETPWSVVWLEHPADVARPWRLHPIGELAPDASTGLGVVDINDDGYPDVMTGGYSQNPRDHDGAEVTVTSRVGRLAWFEHPRDLDAPWIRHDISRRKRGMYDAFVPLDLDGDGDIDFLATRGNSGRFDGVLWLEQVRTTTPVPSFEPARERESAHMPLPPPPTLIAPVVSGSGAAAAGSNSARGDATVVPR